MASDGALSALTPMPPTRSADRVMLGGVFQAISIMLLLMLSLTFLSALLSTASASASGAVNSVDQNTRFVLPA